MIKVKVIFVLLLISVNVCTAQRAKIDEDEKETILEETKNMFWNSDSKEIYKRVIPEKWKGESAVVLERRMDREVFRNSKSYLRLIYRVRNVIKIQNQN